MRAHRAPPRFGIRAAIIVGLLAHGTLIALAIVAAAQALHQ